MPIDIDVSRHHRAGEGLDLEGEKSMRVVGYVRVSTIDQAADGVSLEAQSARIAAWASAHGATLEDGDIYADAGISGKRADNRPGLQRALDTVGKLKGVLVVYSLSRLARSTKDTITIAEQLARAGADLVSLSERIDTTSASGKMVFRLLAVLAEFERDLVSERTKTALAHLRHRGERVGKVPLGSRLAGDGRTLEADGPELATVGLIRRLSAEGRGPYQIAAELNRLGVPTKEGQGPWYHNAVKRILSRPA